MGEGRIGRVRRGGDKFGAGTSPVMVALVATIHVFARERQVCPSIVTSHPPPAPQDVDGRDKPDQPLPTPPPDRILLR